MHARILYKIVLLKIYLQFSGFPKTPPVYEVMQSGSKCLKHIATFRDFDPESGYDHKLLNRDSSEMIPGISGNM